MPLIVIGTPRLYADIAECAIAIILEQDARPGVHCNINVWPAIIIEIVRNGRNRVSRPGFQNPGFLRNISESTITLIVIEDVCISWEATRPAHGRNTLPLAKSRISGYNGFFRIELDEIAYKKIEATIPVIIQKVAPCSPSYPFMVEAGLTGNIRESAVSVVVEKNVVTPERTKQVVPSIVVEVAHAHTGLPASPSQPRRFRYVFESAVSIVLV